MEQKRKEKRSRTWLKEEDDKLRRQINADAKQNWKSVASKAGLDRSPNGCRLRYINHLKPRPRPGKLTAEEKLLTLEFRSQWDHKNCWSEISRHLLPGRRDNDVKNFWHTLAKKATREGRDANSEATLKKAELMETINVAGKFTVDYSSLISPHAYDLLKKLFPHIAGGGSPDFSPIIADGTAASMGCGADPGSDPVPAVEPGNTYSTAPQFHVPLQPLLKSGLFYHGGGPKGFNQVAAAALCSTFTVTSNLQGLSHMLETIPNWDDVVDAQQGFTGGGPIGLNNVMALGNTTSNEIDNSNCSYAEAELDENKAFADYFNFDDFFL